MAEKGHTELLPCPFCGGEGRNEPDGRSPGYWIQCQQCHAQSDDRGSPEMAAKAWNTRTAVNTYPAVEGLVKALEEIAEDSFLDDYTLTYVPTWAAEKARSALSRFRSLQNGGENG
jgi:Lar family restriction alleviation protein